MIIVRNLIRIALEDQKTLDKIFQSLKERYTAESNIDIGKEDLSSIVQLTEALALNANADRKRTDRLINAFTKSNAEKDKLIEKLRMDIEQKNRDHDAFLEAHKEPLKFAKDWFDRTRMECENDSIDKDSQDNLPTTN